MQKVSRNGSGAGSLVGRTKLKKRSQRSRQYALESLEQRVVLSYTFLSNATGSVASAIGAGITPDSLDIYPYEGYLYHSVNNGTPSGVWYFGIIPVSVPAAPSTSVSVILTPKDGSSLTLGAPMAGEQASNLLASFSVTVPFSNKSDTLTIDDSQGTTQAAPPSPYTIDTGALTGLTPSVTGPGFSVNETLLSSTFGGGITLLGSSVDGNVYNVVSVQKSEPFTIVTGSSTSTVNVGYKNTLSISSPLAVYSTGTGTTVNVYDSKDKTSTSASLDDNSPNANAPYELTGLSKSPIEYGLGVTEFNVYGGTAGITWSVSATQMGTLTDLYNNGDDVVYITDDGYLDGILGDVYIENDGWKTYTDLIVDGSNDSFSSPATLYGGATVSMLTDLAPADISYYTADMNSVTITAPTTLAVDFAAGNPIPIPSLPSLLPVPGLSFNGALDGNPYGELILYGENDADPFTDETNNASDLFLRQQKYYSTYTPFFGDIQFTDSFNAQTYLEYTGLAPVLDIVPVTNYTLNDYGYPDQSFTAEDAGPYTTPDGSQSVDNLIAFYSTPTEQYLTPGVTVIPTWEATAIADKAFVTFNAPSLLPPIIPIPQNGLNGTVNIPMPSDELEYLQFNALTSGTNVVNFIAVPDIEFGTGYTGSAGTDQTGVTGTGIPKDNFLYADGGGGVNTLTYDAGGETPTIQPDGSGGLLISIPNYGTVDAINYQTINIVDAGSTVITPGPAVTLNTVEGFNYVDAITGTFTASAPVNIIPTPPVGGGGDPSPGTLPASDFVASIDWGDPSVDADAGSIIQDASNPSIYYVKGSHTYLENGTYTLTDTIGFLGGSYTYSNSTLVPGVNVTVTFGANTTTTPLNPTTVNVVQGALAVSVFPIVGTEGQDIASAPIATFIDAGGSDELANYSATIDIVNAAGLVTLIGAGTITQNGNANQYTVTAPTIPGSAIPESGTYQVEVFVTDSGGATPITVEGASLAVIQNAPLTAVAQPLPLPTENTGVAFNGLVVGAFTDANTYNVATDFTAIIDWGDGSPNSVGTVEGSDGSFTVEGSHIYATYGSFTTTVTVTEVDGSVVSIPGTIDVADLPVTGKTLDFTTVEGLSTGQFVLAQFTDPNTLATVGDVNAQLAIGGWGDGSPTMSGINLVVQEIGVTPITGEPIFDVLGSHTYQTVTPPGTPHPLSVIITTLGGATTDLSSPPGGGVTVLDARMDSSNGTEITGIEGNSTGTVLLGTFTSEDPSAPLSDFSATVDWGGAGTGSTSATITQPGGVGTPFDVYGSYTYNGVGTYAYTVTVNDIGGQSTTFGGSAFIADAPLTAIPTALIATSESPVYPVPEFGVPVFSGLVGSFSSTDPLLTPSSFTATIDWGDGTPNSAATLITQPEGPGTAFDVYGAHTYASSGPVGYTYPITVFVNETNDNSAVTLTNKASVAPIPIVVTGSVSPSSLTGKAGTTDVTSVTQPVFTGTSAPFSNITLYATPVGSTTSSTIGHTEAGSDGSWSIKSSYLATGQYTITASAVDQFGLNATPPFAITPILTVDTTPPVITALSFDRFDATLTVTYQSGLSGMNLQSITNSAFYHISAKPLASDVHVPKLILPTQIYYTPGATPSSPVTVEVVFNNGHEFRGGSYRVVIDSGNGSTGIDSAAGVPMSGFFYGSFPTGDGVPGGDFVADILTFHNTTLPYVPGAGYSPPPAGIDPPAGAKLPKTHSGTAVHNTKVVSNTTSSKTAGTNARLKAVDAALSQLVASTKSKKH